MRTLISPEWWWMLRCPSIGSIYNWLAWIRWYVSVKQKFHLVLIAALPWNFLIISSRSHFKQPSFRFDFGNSYFVSFHIEFVFTKYCFVTFRVGFIIANPDSLPFHLGRGSKTFLFDPSLYRSMSCERLQTNRSIIKLPLGVSNPWSWTFLWELSPALQSR